jgi:DNA repair exonuclease SbcCD ATPase subunit
MERLAAGLVAEFGRIVPPDSLDASLEERVTELDRQIEALRIEAAVHRTRESTILNNAQGLDEAHDDCPVCRRPLDDATVTLAHEHNARDLAAIRQAQAQIAGAEQQLQVRRQRLKSAQQERRATPHPGPEPELPVGNGDEAGDSAESVATAERALATLVEARAAHMQATNALGHAQEANKAMAQLTALFREEAVLRAAVETTESTLTELLDETIRPLASEVNQRWQALFPGRGDIATYSSGKVTRAVNGHQLPYDAFSTGEGMGVVILLRLLITQMATSIDFCWFDEPLEHLDPDVRRKVASMLTRVTNGEHRLRQVVVTTYEEPLARRLRDRDPDTVKLLDVRQVA